MNIEEYEEHQEIEKMLKDMGSWEDRIQERKETKENEK